MGPQLGAPGSVSGVARPELGWQPGCSLRVAAAAEPPPGQALATPWPCRLWSMGRWDMEGVLLAGGPSAVLVTAQPEPVSGGGQGSGRTRTSRLQPGVWPSCVTLGELRNLSGPSVPHL